MPHPFQQLDVFSSRLGDGNPLAVVLGADDLTGEAMQRFAAWTNLSETTFLLTPSREEADYRVRIFTAVEELSFAGHPTLGSCRAWLNAGGMPQGPEVVQECGVGLVRLRRGDDSDLVSFAAPPLRRSGPVDPELARRVESVLGGPPVSLAWGDNGPGWVVAELESGAAVRELVPVFTAGEPIELGVFGRDEQGYEVRAFFRGPTGQCEDPVTGSLNAAIATILAARGELLPGQRYTATQGTALGRRGQVEVVREDDTLWVGGRVVSAISGQVDLGSR
ncbi:PhzF family phenazine biosynthesis protein [Serinicoccus kebangsaanensis]|uniref:PhzF family phenazine biosynthesis protein n=1 Tax=Serinicoccus kebangsaanensis TaxID=2602069 RepID=UPI00124EB2A2|nr:PhzF family phenazine biosynthesis protein [Serinicoccus kebangsaanensis]